MVPFQTFVNFFLQKLWIPSTRLAETYLLMSLFCNFCTKSLEFIVNAYEEHCNFFHFTRSLYAPLNNYVSAAPLLATFLLKMSRFRYLPTF
jgi:hypothetical protein